MTLEPKDGIAIGVSLVALFFSGLSLWLHWRRDKREAAALAPLIEYRLPALDGLGPWDLWLRVKNRSDTSLTINRVITKASNPFRIWGDSKSSSVRLESFDTGANGMRWIEVNTDLAKDEAYEETFSIMARGKRIPPRTPAAFIIEFSRGDLPGINQRRTIRMRTME